VDKLGEMIPLRLLGRLGAHILVFESLCHRLGIMVRRRRTAQPISERASVVVTC